MLLGIIVGLQQTSYITLEVGGLFDFCAQMFVGNLERNVSLTMTVTYGTARGINTKSFKSLCARSVIIIIVAISIQHLMTMYYSMFSFNLTQDNLHSIIIL